MQMEAAIKKYTSEVFLTEDDLYDVDKKQPPRFVTQIKSQTELVEMQSTKFECQLAPVGDPNMKVEWFWNGKPLTHSKLLNFHRNHQRKIKKINNKSQYRKSFRANL